MIGKPLLGDNNYFTCVLYTYKPQVQFMVVHSLTVKCALVLHSRGLAQVW